MKSLITCLSIILFALSACKKGNDDKKGKSFSNVVILGNSILLAPADPSIGWNGSWGMAASAAEKDYVHLLTQKFKAVNPQCEVNIKNIAQFEREFNTYDLDANLKSLKDRKPDLLILRIGENVASDVDAVAFEKRYVALIDYFKTANPDIRVFAAGSFWPNKDISDNIMKKHSAYVSLNTLGGDNNNYAWGQFTDPGVASHPNDKGMQGITNLMWQQIILLN